MKYVINTEYEGYFGVEPDWLKQHGLTNKTDEDEELLRTNEALIKALETGKDVMDWGVTLEVVDIPDEATDWRLFDDYGREFIIYVIDGKLYELP